MWGDKEYRKQDVGDSFRSREDWQDAGQCRDCFQPAFNYRPRSSVQYIMALGRKDASGQPMRFEQLRAEAKACSKPRLKAIYQQVADELMTAIAKLEPYEDKAQFP